MEQTPLEAAVRAAALGKRDALHRQAGQRHVRLGGGTVALAEGFRLYVRTGRSAALRAGGVQDEGCLAPGVQVSDALEFSTSSDLSLQARASISKFELFSERAWGPARFDLSAQAK